MNVSDMRRRGPLKIPTSLTANCRRSLEGSRWLDQLPTAVETITEGWGLTIQEPIDNDEISASWVATVVRDDGTEAVLKLGMPHMEGADEIDGLRFWNGDPTVDLLEADHDLNAMLLERCEPGTFLRYEPETAQDIVIAGLLKRLWRSPPEDRFRPLSKMTAFWADETISAAERWVDAGLVREGLALFTSLAAERSSDVLLATDLHAGNVLRSTREPWLVIDPKPFVGDPAYDATQHLFNCQRRMMNDPETTISGFADLLELEPDRIRLWTFARAAAEHRSDWDDWRTGLARVLAPS